MGSKIIREYLLIRSLLSQKIVLYAGLILLLLGIVGLASNNDSGVIEDSPISDERSEEMIAVLPEKVEVEKLQQGRIIRFSGQDGFAALELLKAAAVGVETEQSSFGEFVISIEGLGQTDELFWIFYVNGVAVGESADSYSTKDSDIVEWRYEK